MSTSACASVFTALALVLYSSGSASAEPCRLAPPARVDRPATESGLATITLTPKAERRLGLMTTPVQTRRLARTRLLGGEIALPAWSDETTGRRNRQSVFAIMPSLAPAEQVQLAQSQIDAEGQVEQARVQLDAARQVLRRAEQMLRDKVGTARAVDEAQALVGLAEVKLQTAQARRGLLGPPLLTVVSPAEVWVRVPVYVGDLSKLDTAPEVRVGGLTGAAGRTAVPVAAPPSANPAAATVDLFYRMPNPDGAFRLGQRVGVTVPLHEDETALVVPRSAVVHDAEGRAWVYVRTAPSVYVRRRVRVERMVDDLAALSGSIEAGTDVVAVGVAELFGTESGVGQ